MVSSAAERKAYTQKVVSFLRTCPERVCKLEDLFVACPRPNDVGPQFHLEKHSKHRLISFQRLECVFMGLKTNADVQPTFCEVCNVYVLSSGLAQHQRGKKHIQCLKNAHSSINGHYPTSNAPRVATGGEKGQRKKNTKYVEPLESSNSTGNRHVEAQRARKQSNVEKGSKKQNNVKKNLVVHSPHCILCDVPVGGSMEVHELGQKHVNKLAAANFGKRCADLEKEKYGVAIFTHPEVPIVTKIGDAVEVTFELRNNGSQHIRCNGYQTIVKNSAVTLGDHPSAEPLLIAPGGSYKVSMTCQARHIGAVRAFVVFSCARMTLLQTPGETEYVVFDSFSIGRWLKVSVHDPDRGLLAPTAPYKPKPRRRPLKAEVTVPGEKPPGASDLPRLIYLPKFQIPKYIHNLFSHDLEEKRSGNQFWGKMVNEISNFLWQSDKATTNIRDTKSPVQLLEGLKSPLSYENYIDRFTTLLYMEERQEDDDILSYNMQGATLAENRGGLILNVPGLAESRPSVLRGDSIYVTNMNDPRVEYEGYVHQVHLEDVVLKFDGRFHRSHIANTPYNVRFTVRRMQSKIRHAAIEASLNSLPKQLLFPANITFQSSLASEDLVVHEYGRQRLNTEQLHAIKNALLGKLRPAPYLVFGPPGTGKTRTLVEYVLQVVKWFPSARVLVCAPSNSATDIIASRLLDVLEARTVLRVNAYQRDRASVPQDLMAVSLRQIGSEGFRLPYLEEILAAKVVAVTCMTAGKLGVLESLAGKGLFSHIAMDEAGHADEADALLPLVRLTNAGGSTRRATSALGKGELMLEGVMLAGDPRQLGPIIRNHIAQRHGLEVSLLGRLMQDGRLQNTEAAPMSASELLSPYARDTEKYPGSHGYNPVCVSMLVKNYRSHPAIIKLPSEMFYHNTLEPCADAMMVSCLERWGGLPAPGTQFPVVFHGINGEDQREGNSPSWFNPDEATVVKNYVEALRDNRQFKVSPAQIGVITPYHKQKLKIRQLLKSKNLQDVKVGSVEEFQGQENLVIILSCVRSKKDQVSEDVRHNIGFLSSPNRFNVAVTRAKALLIVIGNPEILAMDARWGRFLHYCARHSSYTGVELPAKMRIAMMNEGEFSALDLADAAESDVLEGLAKLSLADLGTTPSAANDGESPDIAWRNEL